MVTTNIDSTSVVTQLYQLSSNFGRTIRRE